MSRMLIDCYRSIEASSAKMLEAAQAANWNQVAQFEVVCSVLIGQLHERARCEMLQPEEKREKGLIMRSILMNDAKIRALAEPWMDQLDCLESIPEQRVLH